MNSARFLLYVICFSFITIADSLFADDALAPSPSELVVDGAVGVHICGKEFLHLEDVYPDTPAWKAGIRKGDLLISVDGVPVHDMSVSQIADRIRGKTSTMVTLEVEQASTHTRKTFELTRATIHLPKAQPLPSPVQCIAADLTSKDAYRQFVVRKDYEGGVAAFTQEIAAHPSDVRLLLGVAQLHLSFIRYAEARAAFERALVLDPTNVFAHNTLAIVLSQQGHPTDALRHLELALKANPDYVDAHFNRAVILATNRPPDKPAARESYKRALALGCEPDKELEKLIE
jgi:tetratricopeptide (TPR) repeat protein